MRQGVDISKYQGDSTELGADFVVVNIEDPALLEKIEFAVAHGIPWGLYSWVYPNEQNGTSATRLRGAEGVGLGKGGVPGPTRSAVALRATHKPEEDSAVTDPFACPRRGDPRAQRIGSVRPPRYGEAVSTVLPRRGAPVNGGGRTRGTGG